MKLDTSSPVSGTSIDVPLPSSGFEAPLGHFSPGGESISLPVFLAFLAVVVFRR
jgi:hypothetical protein